MSSKKDTRPGPSTDAVLSPTSRGIVSLVLFIYLFGMWVVVSSSLGGRHSSPVQEKLLRFFELFTEPLNLGVRSSPYALYTGQSSDYEHFFRIEATTPEGETKTYQVPGPMLGSGLSDPYRYQRLAKIVAVQAEVSDDTIPAEITKGIGQYFIRLTGQRKVAIQCIRRRPQPMDLHIEGQQFSDDPRDASYEDVIYRAQVWVDELGAIEHIKEMATEHVAPVQ
ncbi:hypothetical protein DTL21_24790 [Bremerella cremea]|uniref:Uncharacterized protein n=1 Tax=Blastopirellula marina TaxID=124 RepID=A0A2S8FAV1_9BACT|nr:MULTISPECIES: hypothetical protein [Pirellulaceae]PQO29296.1 hypothetical protein C5Y83_24745 [Blastopirellula marina]RCS42600.1 hypothetical protein DTL21_24790 [Bremerella cremea]